MTHGLFDKNLYWKVLNYGNIASRQCRNHRLRTIKKYQNRRLYDTRQSSYITLENVREMIINGEEFCVIDAKNASDVTHHILLQIIGERETQTGTSMLSNELLANLIRFYGDSLQGVLGEYLEDSVSKFIERQSQLRTQMHNVLDPPRAAGIDSEGISKETTTEEDIHSIS